MYGPAANVKSIVDKDGAVLLNGARNEITTLDAMGGYVWRRIEMGMSKREIVSHLVETTGENTATVSSDIDALFEGLLLRQLLVTMSDDPAVNL